METKKCKKCEVEKELTEFNKDKYSKDGHKYRCRECTSLEYKKFYYDNRDYEINRQIKYQDNNKEKVNSRRRKREMNVETLIFYIEYKYQLETD
jgi:hypothetical protein